MKIPRRIAAVVATLALSTVGLAACSSSNDKGAAATEPATLASAAGTWVLESGKDGDATIKPVGQAPVTLTIDADGAVSGSGGCNNLMGSIEIAEGGDITLSPLGRTQMYCEAEMETEDAFVAALEKVDHAEVTADTLKLSGSGVELDFDRE